MNGVPGLVQYIPCEAAFTWWPELLCARLNSGTRDTSVSKSEVSGLVELIFCEKKQTINLVRGPGDGDHCFVAKMSGIEFGVWGGCCDLY